jgi:hypothetical protein
MDEKGVLLGQSRRAWAVVKRGVHGNQKAQDGGRELITVIETVSADGQVLKPMVIFAGANAMMDWFTDISVTEDAGGLVAVDSQDDAQFAVTPSGWTNNDMMLHWLQYYNEQTAPLANGLHRLLIVDGHGSHLQLAVHEFCDENRIILACMPPHSTHLLQPLDVGCFQPLQHYYSQEIDNLVSGSQGLLSITKRLFWRAFREARAKTFTVDTIKSAWAKTGLEPRNCRTVIRRLDEDTARPVTPVMTPANSSTPATPATIRSTRRLGTKAIRDIPEIAVSQLAHAAENALVRNEILEAENARLREALVTKLQKTTRKKAPLVGKTGKVFRSADLAEMRRQLAKEEAAQKVKKPRGRPRKVQQIEPVEEHEAELETPPPEVIITENPAEMESYNI